MRNGRDHENEWYWMISHHMKLLVLREKEEELISSNFVNDQDEDTSTVQGFEDEIKLYQAMKL